MDQFDLPVLQIGTLLCILCILLWSLCVYKEFRRISLALAGAVQIPRGRYTQFREGQFFVISWGRLSLLLFTYFTRIVVASVLLVAGIFWLARTVSTTELMLNAVALNAILDVDEFLFSGLTPMKFQHAIQSLAPMTLTYSKRRSQWESSVQCFMLFVTMWLPYAGLLRPLSVTMLEVKEELCGGNQTFVVSHSAESQITFGLVTASGRGNFEQLTVSEMAVREHKFRSPGETPEAVYISFTSDEDLFGFDIARSMTETAALYPICLETDVLAMGGSLSNDSGIGGGARLLLRQAAAVFGIADADNCTELREYCDDSHGRLLRYACGSTCRCTDPLASPWYRVPHQGCGLPCLALAASEQRGCTDVSPQEAAWAKFWDDYPGVISMHFGTDIQSSAAFPAVNQTIQAMKTFGCSFLRQAPLDFFTTASWCTGNSDLFSPVAQLCPESCGCKSSFDASFCPSACAGNSTGMR
ncbi:unnamed protein product [Durusdinium trenchii]|uniref:Uncharacterized protein n=2 Tax=Durusdinium trenchii TaxID=1381693 RepID=A0ABP0MT79_9DINO